MLYELKSQLAIASWCQRKCLHHLPYAIDISTLQVRHC